MRKALTVVAITLMLAWLYRINESQGWVPDHNADNYHWQITSHR